jgi:phosphoglycolate phosphatase-like HAD superfamily hydrolase
VKTVVLFDIDGTLLLSGGAGRRAMERALDAHFGHRGPREMRYDGKTDPWIVREAMRHAGFTDAVIEARMPMVIAQYLEQLEHHLGETRALPGVHAVVDAVEQADDLVLGVLTGNVVRGAQLKLGAIGLAFERFVVGAFGSDHEERPALAPIAQARASAHLGYPVPGDRLVIIGDTPADMTCGRAVGARAIGVTTGSYGHDDLQAHEAVATFDDLRDTARVLEVIRGA